MKEKKSQSILIVFSLSLSETEREKVREKSPLCFEVTLILKNIVLGP
jgi:hypothetical protein